MRSDGRTWINASYRQDFTGSRRRGRTIEEMGGQHPRCHIVAPANAGKKSNGQGTRGGQILFMLVQGDPESYANKSSKSIMCLINLTSIKQTGPT